MALFHHQPGSCPPSTVCSEFAGGRTFPERAALRPSSWSFRRRRRDSLAGMPSSRKRAQGRARRARAAAPPGGGRADICCHGLPSRASLKSTQRPVLDTFMEELGRSLPSERDEAATRSPVTMAKIFRKQPELFRNDENRTLIRKFIVSQGTDTLLRNADGNDSELRLTSINADMLLVLEGYDSTKENAFDFYDLDFFMKRRDMFEGCKRSLVKFFRKRTPCSCLDEMYAEVKSQPKTGICHHCTRRFERRALKDCTGCRKVQYCSEQCQKADWSRHKEDCKKCNKKLGRTPPATDAIAPVPVEQ